VFTVVPIMLAMLGIVLLAGLVVVYVAYPHRGQDVPRAPWIGEAMRKGVDRMPTLDNQAVRADHRAQERADDGSDDPRTMDPHRR
jgi:hypothetical protein